MIQNEHQYRITQNRLQELEQALAELCQIKDSLRPRQFSARKRGLEATRDTLRQESYIQE